MKHGRTGFHAKIELGRIGETHRFEGQFRVVAHGHDFEMLGLSEQVESLALAHENIALDDAAEREFGMIVEPPREHGKAHAPRRLRGLHRGETFEQCRRLVVFARDAARAFDGHVIAQHIVMAAAAGNTRRHAIGHVPFNQVAAVAVVEIDDRSA